MKTSKTVMTTIIVMMFFILIPITLSTPDDVQLYYDFDTNYQDTSGNGRHGTNDGMTINGTYNTTNGKIDNMSVALAETDYINISTIPLPEFDATANWMKYLIMMWVYFDDGTADAAQHERFFTLADNNYLYIQRNAGTQTITIYHRNNANAAWCTVSSTTNCGQGWCYVSAMWDDTTDTLDLYINGTHEGQDSGADCNGIHNQASADGVNRFTGLGGDGLIGAFDELIIMNTTNTSYINASFVNGTGCNFVNASCADNGTSGIRSITFTYPSNTTQYGCAYNGSILFTTTHNATCSINSSMAYSHEGNLNHSFLNTTYSQGNHTLTVNCSDTTTGVMFNSTIIFNTNTTALMRVYAYDHWNSSLITGASFWNNHTNTTLTQNPFTHSLCEFVNQTTNHTQVTVNISDTALYYQPMSVDLGVNLSNFTFNYSLEANDLHLSFIESGDPINVNGTLHQLGVLLNSTYYFYNSTLLVKQIVLQNTNILVRFFPGSWTQNHSQFYEYINSYNTHINETIEVLNNTDGGTIWIRVMDESYTPIENAYVRYYSVPSTLGKIFDGLWIFDQLYNATFHGQRLTDYTGKTFFHVEDTSHISFIVTREGYQEYVIPVDVDDGVEYTRSAPLDIIISENGTIVTENAWSYVQHKFYNRSASIPFTVMARDRTTVEFETEYSNNAGYSRTSLTGNVLDIYAGTLIPNTHFSSTATSNESINLYIYLDDELFRNITIAYDSTAPTDHFTEAELGALDLAYAIPIVFILLIVLSFAAQLIFSTQASPNIGVNTFKIGSLLIVAIPVIGLNFLWLSLLTLISYILLAMRKVFTE